jgi:hypothetical protein
MRLHSTPRWRRVAVAATLAALTLGFVACGDQPADDVTPAAPPPATAPATTGPPATTPPGTPPVTTTPSAPAARRSAAGQLRGFVAAARTVDARLRRAAERINAGVTATTVTVTPATVAAVEAADPAIAGRKLPAGMNRELLRRALLVYSDLRSRRMAMAPVTWVGGGTVVLPRQGAVPSGASAAEILAALRNGHPAAVHFESDLAALQSLAARSRAFTPAENTSRAAAEVDVRIAYIDGANGGCMSTGGQRFVGLVPLTWHTTTNGEWTGTVNGVGFRTVYRYGGWWRVWLDAC